jgi:uncharacterized protein involved in exopolysaccharide biosynthesis
VTEEEPTGLALDNLLHALRRNLGWIAGSTAACVAVAFVLSALVPNTYESIAKLIVKWGRREQATADSVDDPYRTPIGGRYDDILTEVQLLDSPALYDRAARQPGMAKLVLEQNDPTAKDDAGTPWAKALFHRFQRWCFSPRSEGPKCCVDATCPRGLDAAAAVLRARTSIIPQAGTAVMVVSYLANDAQNAQQVLDLLITEIQRRHQDVFATDTAVGFLGSQLAEARKERDKVGGELAELRRKRGVFDLKTQRTELVHSIGDLDTKRQQTEADLQSVTAQLALYQKWLDAEPAVKNSDAPAQVANPGYAAQLQRVQTLRAERDKLAENLRPDSEVLAEKKRQLDAAEKELADTPMFVVGGGASQTVANTQHDRLLAATQDLGAKKEGDEATLRELATHKTELEKTLTNLMECEPDVARLEEELDAKDASIARLTDAFSRQSITSALDEAKMSNLRTIQRASLPSDKFSPNRRRYLTAGFALGFGAGMLFVLARALLDRSVRSVRDARRFLGVPVLCALPSVDALVALEKEAP